MSLLKKAASVASLIRSNADQAAHGEMPGTVDRTQCPTCNRWYRLDQGHDDCPGNKPPKR